MSSERTLFPASPDGALTPAIKEHDPASPSYKQIAFVSDLGLDPLYIDRQHYWTRREMAGRYFPNPY